MSEENVVTIRGIHTSYIICQKKTYDDPWYPYILHNMSEENVVTIRVHTSYIICQKKIVTTFYILHNMSEENVVTIRGIVHPTFYVRRKRGDDPWYPYILHNMSEV